jgi:hypothetical protein
MIPLDDLLPTNDDSFQPVPSGEFFDTGSPYWEFSDINKWGNYSNEFKSGFYAGLFEVVLKSGKPFKFLLPYSLEDYVEMFVARAKQFNRNLEVEKGEVFTYIWVVL